MDSTISGILSTSAINSFENSRLWIDVLKILLSWPPIIFVLGLLYKTEIKKFILEIINRMTSFHLPGVQVELDPPLQQIQTISTDDDQISSLKKEIAETKNKEFTQHIKEKILPTLNNLSQSLEFERAWNIIFKGQVLILQEANTNGGSIDYLKANDLFMQNTQYAKLIRDGGIDNYLNFLTTIKLININRSEEKNIKLELTDMGRDFLSYVFSERKYSLSMLTS